jgi:hypothetical protein
MELSKFSKTAYGIVTELEFVLHPYVGVKNLLLSP